MSIQLKKITFVCAIALAVGVSSCSENKTSADYLAAANVYVENANYTAAIIEFKNAIRLAPKNIEARYQLGRLYLSQGDYLSAEKELEKANSLGGDDENVMVDIAFIKLKLDKPKELKEIISENSHLGDENYIAILSYGVAQALRHNNSDLAMDYYQQAKVIDIQSVHSDMAAVYTHYNRNEYEEGLRVADLILDRDPDFSEALLLKGHLLYTSEKFSKASEIYSYYVAKHPLDFEVQFREASSNLRSGDIETAEVKIDKLLKLFNDAPLANEYKAQIEYQKENFEDARRYADKALQGNNQFVIARIIAGVSAYKQARNEQAYAYLLPLDKTLPLSHPVMKIFSALRIRLGYAEDAANMFVELGSITKADVGFLQATSEEFLLLGDIHTAKNLIEKATALAPNNVNVAMQKSQLQLSQNDKEAISTLEHVVSLDPELDDVELVLAIQYLDNNEEEKAQKIAGRWIDSSEQKAQGYFLLATINAHKNLSTEAKKYFLKSLEIEPNNTAALYSLATIADEGDDYQAAADYYQQVLTLLPSHEAAIIKLSRLRYQHKESIKNIDFLKQLASKNKDNVVLTLGLAQNLRIDNKLKDAIALLEGIKSKNGLPAGYWTMLGDSYIQAKNMLMAEESFNEAIKVDPNNLVARMRAIGILEYSRKYKEALKVTEESLALYQNNNYLLVLKANFQLLTGETNPARVTVAQLHSKKINHHLVNKFTADLALLDKDYDTAIEHFNILYEKQTSGLNAMFLARALKFGGKRDEAAQTLEIYLAGVIKDHQVRMLLAELYMQYDSVKAMKHLKIIEQDEKNNPVLLNNLAMLALKNSNTEHALMYAKRAVEIKSDNHMILDTYGIILISANKFEQAIPVLEKALSIGGKAESTYITLAKAYLSVGNKDKLNMLLDSIEDKETYAKVELLIQ